MAHLVLVRGLPGSGKSTFARDAYPTYEQMETDKLFMKNGVYVFDPKMLKAYHNLAQVETRRLLGQGKNVVVANTFTQLWEMQPYLDMHHPTTVYHVNKHLAPSECAELNTHGVPHEAVARMALRWEDYQGELFVKTW
jgi:predicted kinase